MSDVPFEIMIGVQTLSAEAFAVGLVIGPLLGGLLAQGPGFAVAGMAASVPSAAFAVIAAVLLSGRWRIAATHGDPPLH